MSKLAMAAVVAAIGLAAVPTAGAAEMLISKDEAARPAPADLGSFTTRGLTRGPRIDQVSPDPHSAGAKSPFALAVRFTAHNETTVVPDSVQVTYLKSPSVDLTPRLKSHISASGIDMSDAEVPPGTHMIRIEVRDSQGRKGSGIITLSVLP